MRCLYCHDVIKEEMTLITLFTKNEPLCLTCRAALNFKYPGERCGRCHQLVRKEADICADCHVLIDLYPAVNKIYTATDYNEEIKMLMHRYKFVKDYALSEVLALLISFNFKCYDYVVPIPVSSARLKERTYNQTSAVMRAAGVTYTNMLGTGKVKRQSELSKHERLSSTNPFYLLENVKDMNLSGKSVLIADDIYTTGITVHQAADVIKDLNFQNIDVFTFSKTQHI